MIWADDIPKVELVDDAGHRRGAHRHRRRRRRRHAAPAPAELVGLHARVRPRHLAPRLRAGLVVDPPAGGRARHHPHALRLRRRVGAGRRARPRPRHRRRCCAATSPSPCRPTPGRRGAGPAGSPDRRAGRPAGPVRDERRGRTAPDVRRLPAHRLRRVALARPTARCTPPTRAASPTTPTVASSAPAPPPSDPPLPRPPRWRPSRRPRQSARTAARVRRALAAMAGSSALWASTATAWASAHPRARPHVASSTARRPRRSARPSRAEAHPPHGQVGRGVAAGEVAEVDDADETAARAPRGSPDAGRRGSTRAVRTTAAERGRSAHAAVTADRSRSTGRASRWASNSSTRSARGTPRNGLRGASSGAGWCSTARNQAERPLEHAARRRGRSPTAAVSPSTHRTIDHRHG